MIRRTMLKMLAAVPLGGFAPLCLAKTNVSQPYDRNTDEAIYYNLLVKLDSHADSTYEFRNCEFINCTFKRLYKTSIVKFTNCTFKNCGQIELYNGTKDEFTGNTVKGTLCLIGHSIPNEEISRRRANGEIA